MGPDHAAVPLPTALAAQDQALTHLDFELQLGVDGVQHLRPLHPARALVAQTHQLQRARG